MKFCAGDALRSRYLEANSENMVEACKNLRDEKGEEIKAFNGVRANNYNAATCLAKPYSMGARVLMACYTRCIQLKTWAKRTTPSEAIGVTSRLFVSFRLSFSLSIWPHLPREKKSSAFKKCQNSKTVSPKIPSADKANLIRSGAVRL